MTKPQFFESYRSERDNSALLDVAAGYMARKAVGSHPDPSINGGDSAASWGGMASRAVLATELVPMAVKIQSLTNGEELFSNCTDADRAQIRYFLSRSAHCQCLLT